MRYIKFFPPIIFVIIVFVATNFHVKDINVLYTTILGIVTFLMSVFIAFSISDRHNRIDELRSNDSTERAELVLLNDFSEHFGQKQFETMRNVIDQYFMATLDYNIWDYYKTENHFKKIVDTVCSMKAVNNQQSLLLDHMLGMMDSISIARKKTIGILQDRLSKFEWGIFLLLSLIIVISLLLINIGSFLSVIIICIISIVIFLVLFLLYKLDTLSWKEEARIFEPYQQAFESIGSMRYYPEDLIKEKRVKNYTRYDYRMGIFSQPYPDLSGKKIKVIKKSSH